MLCVCRVRCSGKEKGGRIMWAMGWNGGSWFGIVLGIDGWMWYGYPDGKFMGKGRKICFLILYLFDSFG